MLFQRKLAALALGGLMGIAPLTGAEGETPAGGETKPATAPTTTAMDPAALMTAAQKAFLYVGGDMKAKITMVLYDKAGKERKRVLTMLRRNADDGDNQKYFIYFHEPGDVRKMSFMVYKFTSQADDRWLFIPAVDMVRRIAADDSRSSFVGSDFTYEDVSGRNVSSDTHALLKEEKLGEQDCYVVESKPKTAVEFARKLTWIDKKTSLPLKEEYYDAQNTLYRVFTADKIEEVAMGEGEAKKMLPTILKRTMKNLKTGTRTEVSFDTIAYGLGLKDEEFSERNLRKPPREWTN